MHISSQVFCDCIKYLEKSANLIFLFILNYAIFINKKKAHRSKPFIKNKFYFFDNNSITSGKSIPKDFIFSIVGTPSLFQPRRL